MSEILVRLQKIDGLNSLNLTFSVGVWEFLLKKKYCKKYLIACPLTETEDHINPFQVEVHSPGHLRTSENLCFFIFLGG